MACLGQTLKLPKTYGKRLYKRTRVVLYKRRLEKTANTQKIGRFGKLEKWPLWKGYSLCKIASLGETLKLPKTYRKQLCDHITVVLCKKSLEKTPNIWKIRRFWKLEKWLLCKGYSLCKMVSLRQKIKLLKTCEKRLHKHITAVLFKKRSKKHLIFEKWDDFENRQKWPLCKGYSLCKMVSLRQNIKLSQTCVKRHYKHITFVLCKRRLEKTANIRKIGRFGKLEKWPLCKGYSLCKMPSLAQTLKLPKTCVKRHHKHITAVLFKKPSKKHLIFEKWDDFENRQKWPLCKGYSLSKMPTLAQTLKLLKTCVKRLQKHITAVLFKTRSKKHLIFEKWDDFENRQKWPLCKGCSLCKMVGLRQNKKIAKNMRKTTSQAHHRCSFQKTLEKAPNIRKMRRFWKSAKMATMQRL